MTETRFGTAKCVLPVSINAPVDEVFPLACPVKEYLWIPGWKCNLIHCPNERVELGTVFSELSSAPFLIGSPFGKTTWTAVLHDPQNHKIHFRLENEHSSSLYRIELEDDGNGRTAGRLDFTYTATTKRGSKLVRRDMEGKLHVMLTVLNAMLTHYSEHHEMLPSAGIRELVASDQRLALGDKILIGLNRVVRSKVEDENRSRFVSDS